MVIMKSTKQGAHTFQKLIMTNLGLTIFAQVLC